MNEYTNFGELLADQAKSGSMPDVLFTDNGDLRGSLYRLGAQTSVDRVLSETDVKASVEMFGDAVSDKLHNETYTNVFTRISDIFGTKLYDSVQNLHQIKQDVTELEAKYAQRIEDKIAEDPTMSKLCNVTKELKMDSVKWGMFDIIDERAVRANISGMIDHDHNEKITHTNINLAINKLPCANTYNKITLNKIFITKSKFDKIVYAVSNVVPDIGPSTIAGILRNTLELTERNMQAAVRAAHEFANGTAAHKINHVLTNATNYIRVYNALTEDMLDFSASSLNEFRTHSSCLESVANVLLYICSYYRNEVWNNAVLVPGPYINEDNLEDFKQLGGSVTNIVHHVSRFYSNDRVPMKGVSGDFISRTAETISKELSESIVQNTKLMTERKREIEYDAFIYVASEYLRNHKSQLSKTFAYRSDTGKYADSIYHAHITEPTSLKFYKLILNSEHIGDMTTTLFDRLNKAYTAQSAELGSVSAENKQIIETKVYADMMAEYLIDSGLIVI